MLGRGGIKKIDKISNISMTKWEKAILIVITTQNEGSKDLLSRYVDFRSRSCELLIVPIT